MAEDTKDTIYIDVDDEITNVIDKVADSDKKLVALVLPKRASVFQSVVNMKLLKRKADEAKKNLVLVTNDANLLPLAGIVGIHVAKTLSSKPEIPAAPIIDEAMVEAAEDEIPTAELEPEVPAEADEMKNDALKEINDSATKSKPKASAKDLDTIELDNTGDEDKAVDTAMPAVAAAEAKKKAKKNKDKSLKIPNFNKFRLIALLGGGGLIILIVLFILLFKILPHATVDIKTNAQNVDANFSFNLGSSSAKLNTNTNTVPSKQVTETKTYTATVNATGQQNNGQKANGSVTLVNCSGSVSSVTIPAGTGISGNNSLTYITQNTVTLPPATFFGNNHCTQNSTTNVTVNAQNGGSSYNVNNASFTISGYSGVTGSGSVSGGTDDNVTVVSQSDINNAENKVTPDTTGAKTDLTNQLNQSNFYPLSGTFTTATPTISPNAGAGTAANSVTVTETIKYTMYGVIQTSLIQLLNNNIKSQVNGNQSIINNGLSSASFSTGSSPTNITLSTTAVVGPDINVANLKSEIVGQKVGSIQSIVKSDPDVSSVSVKLSPFYVSKAPSASKITINIAKPTNNPNASNN